jgi:endonuclease YncB( thermonuclease family)
MRERTGSGTDARYVPDDWILRMAHARPTAVLSLLCLALVPQCAAASPAAQAANTCSDYSNQADAQRAADTRDPDHDGVYCESLPCPCLKPGQGGGGGPTPTPPKRAQRFGGRVVSVTDGDTIKVRIGKKLTKVRIIGIDTPETHKPGVKVECGGPAASANMHRLAPVGAHVSLRTDPTQDKRDRYGRLLAYVGRAGHDLGRAQVAAGLAKVYVFGGHPFQRAAAYRRSAAKAKRLARGVYTRCGGNFHSEQ